MFPWLFIGYLLSIVTVIYVSSNLAGILISWNTFYHKYLTAISLKVNLSNGIFLIVDSSAWLKCYRFQTKQCWSN